MDIFYTVMGIFWMFMGAFWMFKSEHPQGLVVGYVCLGIGLVNTCTSSILTAIASISL